MTRKQEIEEMAKTTASHITSDKDMQVAFADALRRGAQWADKHPKPVRVTFKEFEDAAKEVIDKDWQEQQDRLWNMIERNLRAQFIRKVCKWLKEQSCCGYIEDIDVNEFVEQFKQAMKGE